MREALIVFAIVMSAAAAAGDPVPCSPLMTPSNVYITWRGEWSGCASSLQQDCTPGEIITFQAQTFNYSLSCAPHQFAWSFGDGATASGPTVQHLYAQPAVYNVSLTITKADQSITLQGDLRAAVIEFRPFAYEALKTVPGGYRFTVDAAQGVGDWVWDFGDGTVVTGPQREQSHVYRTGGTFVVHLTSTRAWWFAYSTTLTVPKPRRRSARH